MAFLTSIALTGTFLAPIAAGQLIDASSYETAFLVAGILGVLGALLTRYAPESETAYSRLQSGLVTTLSSVGVGGQLLDVLYRTREMPAFLAGEGRQPPRNRSRTS